VLAIDLGTGGPKTAFVTVDGQVLGHELVEIATTMLPGGGAVQDPGTWWDAIRGSTRRLVDAGTVRPDDVVGITCTGQWGSTVPVGPDGAPVGPCLLWMDARGGRHAAAVLGGWGPLEIEGYGPTKALRFIRASGGAPALQGNDPLGHVLHLRNEEPDVYRAASVFLEPVDYLGLRFTGRPVATPASMILSWLVDIRHLDRPTYAPGLVRLTTRDPATLPELVPTGSVIGGLARDVADELGLPAGIPVVTGVPDLLSATTGSGALGDYELHMAISTTSWLSCHVPFKKTDPFRQVATVPGVRAGRYLVANNHDTAGICLQWFRDAMFAPGAGQGPAAAPSYAALDSVVEATGAGSGGVLFAPWLGGERCPVDDRTLRGSFLNLSLSSTRDQMLRSVFEGVALNARWMQDAVEHFLGRPTGPIRFIGGGASSDVWCQIHADVMERPVHQVAQPLLANVRGAALYAALALGKIDLRAAATASEVAQVFEPRSEHRHVYRELYGQFRTLYRQQHRMYAALNRSGGPFDRSEDP
jgi:xylulokinase